MTTAICSTLILVFAGGSGNVFQNVRNFIGTRDFPKAETMYSVPFFCVCYRSWSMPMLCLLKPNIASFLVENFDVRIFIAYRGGQCMPGFTLRHPFLKAWS